MITSRLNQTRLAVFALLLSAAPLTHAATDININAYYNGSWATRAVNGSSISTAPTTGNTGTGITFADWNGNLVGTGAEFGTAQTMLVSLNATALPSAPIVNALFNTFYARLYPIWKQERVGKLEEFTFRVSSYHVYTTRRSRGRDSGFRFAFYSSKLAARASFALRRAACPGQPRSHRRPPCFGFGG